MYDIIIVGAGTAGLTSAIYGIRAGKKILVLEGMTYGGQIINSTEIENYPAIKHLSGFEFATELYEQAVGMGTEIKYEKALKIEDDGNEKTVVTKKNKYTCKTVILATGAKNRPLGLENEQKLTGLGISYCAACDGAFFKGKTVAVAGGGNTAMEDAVFLSTYCPKVYIINRESEFKGESSLKDAVFGRENIEVIYSSIVLDLEGENRLEGIIIENISNLSRRNLTVEGLFVAIGQIPDNQNFADIVSLNEKGYIKAGENCKTNVPGIFAAGDCRTKDIRQLTTAAADGAVAALAACEYIR